MLQSLRFRIILLAVSSLLAIAIGFVVLSPLQAVVLVQHAGYFVILTAVAAFVWSGFRLVRALPATTRWTSADTRLALLCLVITVLWQVHGIHGFKVLMDELVLNATGMSMHFDRQVYVPLKTHDVNGIYVTLAGIVDKRPLLFPFLLSVGHDLTGYRPENAIVLNGLLSLLLLFTTGRVARRLGGQEHAGTLAVLLLGGLPLLTLNATGGGFEVLNLLMIATTVGLGWTYLERNDATSLDAFVLSGVLLAQTRYESALFVPAVGLIVLLGWWRARRVTISWGLVAAPLLMLPVPLIERLFRINENYWQVRDGNQGPFSLDYFTLNLGSAVEFLFTVDGFQLSSPLLSALGVTCLLFAIVFVLRRPRQTLADPVLTSAAPIGGFILVNFALLLCYHWGQLQDFVATRLALPLLLLFALAAAFACGRWVRHPRWWLTVLGVPALWLFTANIPLTARAEANRTFLTFQEVEWQHELIRAARDHDLFALPSSLPAIIQRRPALAVLALNERAAEMQFHLERHTYNNVWVFQHIAIDPATHTETVDKQSTLGPEFILETVAERRFKPTGIGRWSRLVAVDLTRQAPRPPDWQPQTPPFEINITADDPSPEGRYVEEFLKKLP